MMFDFEKGRIKFIRGGKYPQCHSLFVDDRTRVVIDPSSDEKKLLSIRQDKPVDILINSHAHEDHLVYNTLFRSSALWVHEAEAHAFEAVENLLEGYGDSDEATRQGWIRFLLEDCHYEPRKADRLLRGGEIVELGEVEMEIVHTPGHTPGHLSFYFPREKILFLGDLDLVKAGPYYGDVHSSIEDTISSLNRLKGYPCETYLTAHGKGIHEGDPAHIERYLASIYRREESLVEFLREAPRTLKEITEKGIIYGPNKTLAGVWDLGISERAMMEKHLRYLMKRDLVRREGDLFHYQG
jgi:glyoxylase-like metal-dependent hydrolase (beta-lactamase superfamily II)